MNHGRRFHLPLPPATKALFVANVAVFVANLLTFGLLSSPAKGAWFAFSWPGLLDGYGLGLLRVVTYQFTHSFVDPMHVLMNMLALWVFGPMVEARLGRLGTLRAYLWAGVAGAIGHLVVAVLQGSTAVQARIVFFIVQVPLWALASLLCGLGAYSTFVELATGHAGGVAHSAHLGGAALGFVAFRLGWFRDWLDLAGAKHPGPIARWREGWRRRSAARSQAATEARELQLDAILAKVKAEGLAALRPDERRFLERMSERARGPGS
jgi:membrane associated rhomboid family serine protease